MKTITIDIQAALIEQCRQGVSSAQEEIYKRYAKNMYNSAYRILGHRAEAEDVLQESFLDAFTKINEYRADSSFGAWIKRIVINKSISLLRKRKMDWLDETIHEIPADTIDFEIIDDDHTTIHKIKNAMDELPSGYRMVLSLYLFEGFDHVEIAQILKISESTSKTQYLRAKNKLKELLIHKNIVGYETR